MSDPIRDSINDLDKDHRAATYKTLAQVEAVCNQMDRLERDIRDQRKEDSRISERLNSLKFATPEDLSKLWDHLREWETELSARNAGISEKVSQISKSIDELRADAKDLRQTVDFIPENVYHKTLSKGQVAGAGAGFATAIIALNQLIEWLISIINPVIGS